MSPIDDELRSALSSRTDSLSPSPDFFAGVERRATRLRRQRVAGAVAGSALAVSALGLGGPMLASSLTSTAPNPSEVASSAPEPGPSATALDPSAPWEYRGDPLDSRSVRQSLLDEWALRHSVPDSFTPLYGEVDDSSQVVVFVATDSTGSPWWGVGRSSESGWEFPVDERLAEGTYGLPYAFRTADADRLLLVAHPATTLEYNAGGQAPWRAMESLAPGVGITDLDGDPGGDSVAIKGPDGVVSFSPPSLPPAQVEDEGPGTDLPPFADSAPYALDLDDPWAYRGPAEATLHPDLGSQDERLFVERGTGRDDGSWSQRPLLLVEDEPSGTSVLMVLHRRGGEAYVTTTWQTQDGAPRHSEQAVQDGQLLVQTVLPDVGPGGLLIALASPKAGAVETDLTQAADGYGVGSGVLVRELPADPPAGSVFLYSEGDGLLYHSAPARRS